MASLIKRNGTFYIQWCIGPRLKRRSLHTDSKQIAKDKLRQFESADLRGADSPLPTKTPIPAILAKYAEHIRTVKTAKSAQTDIYYLRQVFGPVCDALKINSRKPSLRAMKRPPKEGQDRRFKMTTLELSCLEQVTTTHISDFISAHVRSRGLAPKTANRYREILCRLFNWAIAEQGVRVPGGANPVAAVARYAERAAEIRFLTLTQIDEQLEALKESPQLQAMVAMLIYAGLRREELLWLTHEDIDFKTGPYGMIRIRGKTINGESWQPKTKVNRAVPISSTLREWLDQYKPRPSVGGWYFPSPQSVTRYDTDNFSRDLRAANEQTKMEWTCLDYRHTFGSQLAMKGESLYKISQAMGNSPEICRRHYAAITPASLVETVEFRQPARQPIAI